VVGVAGVEVLCCFVHGLPAADAGCALYVLA